MAQQTETNSDKSEVITEKDNFSLQCSECTFTSKDSKIMKGHTAAKHGHLNVAVNSVMLHL